MLKSQQQAVSESNLDFDAIAAADFQWLSDHEAALLAAHSGKWIAVWREAVIAIGEDAAAVSTAADHIAPTGGYTLHKLDPITAELL